MDVALRFGGVLTGILFQVYVHLLCDMLDLKRIIITVDMTEGENLTDLRVAKLVVLL